MYVHIYPLYNVDHRNASPVASLLPRHANSMIVLVIVLDNPRVLQYDQITPNEFIQNIRPKKTPSAHPPA